MNIQDEYQRHPQRVLDRLIDGELTASERRGLLVTLEAEPGAWRACALAFLEGQTMQQALSVASQRIASQAPVRLLPAPARARASAPSWAAWLAVTAGLLVAFTLGRQYPAAPLASTNPAPNDPVAVVRQPDAPSALTTTSAEPTFAPTFVDHDSVADDSPNAARLLPLPELPETITIALEQDGVPTQVFKLPLIEADEAELARLASAPASLPEEFVREMRAAGIDVTTQQHLCTVELSDGRQVIVPVQRLQINSALSSVDFY